MKMKVKFKFPAMNLRMNNIPPLTPHCVSPLSASLCFAILFKDGHVLQLTPETVAVRRRMRNGLDDYDVQMVPGNICGLNFLTFVLQLRENLI